MLLHDEKLVSLDSSQNYEFDDLYCFNLEKIEFEENPSSNDEFEKVFSPFNGNQGIQASISPS
jgi:hypothetical protein